MMYGHVNTKIIVLTILVIFSFIFGPMAYGRRQRPISNLKKRTQVPAFNQDSAYFFIQNQVQFGPRVPNTPSHSQCVKYLKKKLQQFSKQVHLQAFQAKAFNGTILDLKNLIACINPDCKKRILLAAHWDTCPFADKDKHHKYHPIDGANDGASGVGVLLEIARVMWQSVSPKVGVDIIFFDGEDYGEPHDYSAEKPYNAIFWCLGSQYWSKNKHQKNYTATYGILLDMVGASGAKFHRDQHAMYHAPHIVKKVWEKANQIGYGKYFISQNNKNTILDDHVFVNIHAQIPMINIIDTDLSTYDSFPTYHHTLDDNLQCIDKKTLKAVGETLLHIIYQEEESVP